MNPDAGISIWNNRLGKGVMESSLDGTVSYGGS